MGREEDRVEAENYIGTYGGNSAKPDSDVTLLLKKRQHLTSYNT